MKRGVVSYTCSEDQSRSRQKNFPISCAIKLKDENLRLAAGDQIGVTDQYNIRTETKESRGSRHPEGKKV